MVVRVSSFSVVKATATFFLFQEVLYDKPRPVLNRIKVDGP